MINKKTIQILATTAGLAVMIIFFFNIFGIRVEDESVRGIITKKYIDTANHYAKRVVIKERVQEQQITLYKIDGGMWDFILIGDSIIKSKGSNEYIIKRDTIVKNFYVKENFWHL
jgi:hypothetical protein